MKKLIVNILLMAYAFSGTDLYVKYNGKSNNFNTVQEAVNKAAEINPKSESERVTIHIAPGTYRQQIIVRTPYITFINDDTSNDVILTWYYARGYKYYSANEMGYYDENLAQKKSSKHAGRYRWGATVLIFPEASYFKAKNIVFENSFNRYMTKEEIDDGVEILGDPTDSPINVPRVPNLDVKSAAATERGAALAIDAPYGEFLNCKFYSSQDTLFTGGSPLYFKKCLIEGQTDYIFGESNTVFDSCELRWKGYSTGSLPGFITAARTCEGTYTGYLMYNCKVTKNKALTVTPGYLGRPWRDTAKVMFINTVLEEGTIVPEGWDQMNGVPPETIEGFKEYGTKLENGAPVNLSQRKGHVISQSDAERINIINYMNNWTPSFM
jgi:pectin methylesterase-like acyl-CoA thioesterase